MTYNMYGTQPAATPGARPTLPGTQSPFPIGGQMSMFNTQMQQIASQYPALANQLGLGTTPVQSTPRIRPVSSIEEARASAIDFDGSVFYFTDTANKKIYTKQINLDGTSTLNMYELREIPVPPQPEQIAASYVSKDEFQQTIALLLEEINKTKGEPINHEQQQPKQQLLTTDVTSEFKF